MGFLSLLYFLAAWAWLITDSRDDINSSVDQLGLDEYRSLVLVFLYGVGLLAYPLVTAVVDAAIRTCARLARRPARRQRWFGAYSTVHQGQRFEVYLKEQFQRQGFHCEHVGKGGRDGGADLILSKRGRSAAVQAKYWSGGRVGQGVVREVYWAKLRYSCDEAWIITTTRFTQEARQLADTLGVRLYDSEALSKWRKTGRWPASIPPHPSCEP